MGGKYIDSDINFIQHLKNTDVICHARDKYASYRRSCRLLLPPRAPPPPAGLGFGIGVGAAVAAMAILIHLRP